VDLAGCGLIFDGELQGSCGLYLQESALEACAEADSQEGCTVARNGLLTDWASSIRRKDTSWEDSILSSTANVLGAFSLDSLQLVALCVV
jgi:hypothetical protein